MSISRTTHCSASAAFFGLVMIGVIRCGTPSYAVSSTRLGSMSTMRTSSGVERMSTLVISVFMQPDLPAPVAPATRMCGIFARLPQTKPPSTSLPRPTSIGWWSLVATLLRSTSPRLTSSRSVLGISMPIADLPGIGLRMRTSALATAYAMFLLSAVTFSTLTAGPELDLVARDRRAARVAGDLGVDVELLEHRGERADDGVGGLARGLVHRTRLERLGAAAGGR